jgi:hypothetical protein
MDVYLIPAGGGRHALYSEPPQTDHHAEAEGTTLRARAVHVFRRAVAEGEQARQPDAPPATRGRLRAAVTRRLAEAVAEQRLLWHLRHLDNAQLVHPDDVPSASALAAAQQLLRADRDKHRRWLVIDLLLTLLSAPVALLPGPNLLAYYFLFRVIGHYLSWRGADRGLAGVTWSCAPSPLLTSLRAVWSLDDGARAARLQDVAAGLGLDRLPAFFNRIAERPA